MAQQLPKKKWRFPWGLAITGIILGFLIGGIFKGTDCTETSRITATVAQVKAYEAALSSFRDSYKALPGDMADTSTIPNCNINCNPLKDGAGNYVIGDIKFGSTLKSGLTSSSTPPSSVNDETILFWQHLLQADLISGITNTAIHQPTPLAWGETMPAARGGGGFVVGFAYGNFPENLSPQNEGLSGTILVLKSSPDDSIALDAPNQQPLSPARAAQIDRRMDDGKPNKGFVQAYGAPSCFKIEKGIVNYAEANLKKDCGLIFRIQDPQ